MFSFFSQSIFYLFLASYFLKDMIIYNRHHMTTFIPHSFVAIEALLRSYYCVIICISILTLLYCL